MNARQFTQWQDLFVVFDDGSIPIWEYGPIESAMREQARQFPQGIACLTVLPPDAKPPPDEIKRTVKDGLTRLAPSLTCLAYLVEGTGFRGIAARATLVGMKIFSSRPYPIYVEVSVTQALGKMIAHLANRQAISIDSVVKLISETRMAWKAPVPPVSAKDSEVSLK